MLLDKMIKKLATRFIGKLFAMSFGQFEKGN